MSPGGSPKPPSLPLGGSTLRLNENLIAALVFFLFALVPLVLSGYPVYILPQFMLYGVLGLSLGLLWGFGGILSFGQTAFFMLGGYSLGLMMGADLWINPAYVGILIGIVLCSLTAALVGYFLFSVGIRPVYFVLSTLALAIIAEQLAVSQSQITGGWNGMYVPRFDLTLGPLGTLSLYEDVPMYYFILVCLIATYAFLKYLLSTHFGKILVGIRENEDRMIALGFDVSHYKTGAFALSGAVAGLAGALYGSQSNFITPDLGGVLFSTEVVIWVAVGGRQSLLGALMGAVVVGSLSTYLSAMIPDFWRLILGFIFVIFIIFFKRGLAGALSDLPRLWRSGS